MSFINVEMKARSNNHDAVRTFLRDHNAVLKGTDHQIDTYFIVPNGRLKLREGTIENNLIHYDRSNQSASKLSEIALYATSDAKALKETLTRALPVLAVVDKTREIYFIDNVKFHIDTVAGLGTFVEIEARDYDSVIGQKKLREQCETYMRLLDIKREDLLAESYSDMILSR